MSAFADMTQEDIHTGHLHENLSDRIDVTTELRKEPDDQIEPFVAFVHLGDRRSRAIPGSTMLRAGGLLRYETCGGFHAKAGRPHEGKCRRTAEAWFPERRGKMARRRQLGFGGFPNFVEVRLQGLGKIRQAVP